MNKLKTLEDLGAIAVSLRGMKKKIVHCHGVFDLLHIGHIRHLEEAKQLGDILIVTVTPDKYVNKGPDRPVFNQDLRAEAVAALDCVDYVAINKWPTAVKTIKILRPNFYVKGNEYGDRLKDYTGGIDLEEIAVKFTGGKIVFTDNITFSSSNLINRYFSFLPRETQDYLSDFSSRYKVEDIIAYLEDVRSLKVLTVGEAIIDEYQYCEPMGKSLKSHLLVNKYLSEEFFAGGSLAVSNQVAGLCKKVHLVTLLGEKDSREEFISKNLESNIQPKFFYRNDGPTIVKRRFVHKLVDQKVFEVCYINDTYIQEKLEKQISEYLKVTIPKYDLVIVSDFGHGFLSSNLIKTIQENARLFAVNTQTNSANVGYNLITKYHQPNYVCLDEPEARLAIQDRESNIKDVGISIISKIKSKALIITRGNDGSLGFKQGNEIHQTPSFTSRTVDRVGAGDAFFAFTAPCFAKGMPLDITSFIGNAVGALAVQIVCNRESVNLVNLYKFIATLLK